MRYRNGRRFAIAANLLSQSARSLLNHDAATEIIKSMEVKVRGAWYSTAHGAGVPDRDSRRIALPSFILDSAKAKGNNERHRA